MELFQQIGLVLVNRLRLILKQVDAIILAACWISHFLLFGRRSVVLKEINLLLTVTSCLDLRSMSLFAVVRV
jgi:hypothetical protein